VGEEMDGVPRAKSGGDGEHHRFTATAVRIACVNIDVASALQVGPELTFCGGDRSHNIFLPNIPSTAKVTPDAAICSRGVAPPNMERNSFTIQNSV
jgi:hypothetical protein